MHSRRLGLFVLALLCLAGSASATSYVMVPDPLLADQAAVVVEGTVETVGDAAGAAGPLTEARVRVERQVKGRVTSASLRVRTLGGTTADGRRLVVWGAPALRAGERVLLFLVPHPDGAYRTLHFGLGAFHQVDLAGRRLALRDLGEAEVFAPDGGAAAEPARDFAGFSRWVADRAAGLRRAQDYFVELPAGPAKVVESFTFLGGQKHRWFQFDSGQSVGFRAHASGQAGVAGGGFTEFQTGINAWNNDPGSNVRYRYDGTTTASKGFTDFDNVNAILFEDPNAEIGGTFSCTVPGSGSGTLAVGGAWADPDNVRDGFLVIGGGDIITNDGVGCWFTTSKRAEQVFGHELGHTLGLGHSCGDDASGACSSERKREALMRAQAHADERGARLNDDDKEGIAFLYPNIGGGGSKPAAPSGLTAAALSSNSIQLAWTDNASNETSYRVERKTGGGAFTEIKQLGANATSFTVTGLSPATTYTFRVRAKNASGFSPYSNEAGAKTQDPPLPAAPANLTAAPLSPTQVALTWQDKSSNETGFRIEVSDPRDPFLAIEIAPANATSLIINGLGPDFPYTFRIRAENANGPSAYSNEANVTIPSPGPCVVTSQNLCLLAGRFRVMVQWRIPASGANGVATAVPNSDQTGLFWFFDASNIEVIVKVLDGRPVNNSFWTIYGGLSDVEYWVSATDVQTGDTATYHNKAGSLCGKADVGSFPQAGLGARPAGAGRTALPAIDLSPARKLSRLGAAPAGLIELGEATPTIEALCAAGPNTLCLLGGRFQVQVAWQTGSGSGVGTAVPYGDATGFFWFFDPSNTELVVKVLDGRPLNGKFWFFYGALSDVQYTLTVTDTMTGATKTYHNAQGNLCGKGDTSAF